MKTSNEKRILIPEQEILKELFGKTLSFATIVRLRAAGQLPPHIKIANRHWYRKETVDAWLISREAVTAQA